MDPLRWDLPHGVHVAMSLAADGDLRLPALRGTWCAQAGLPAPAVLRQVHGATVILRPEVDGEPDADAQASRQGDAALGVYGADCPSVVIAAPDALGVAHAGWRGTAAGIVARLAAAMRGLSRHDPATWMALVGPGVHPDDFEVDAPVLDARAWPAGCLRRGRPGHAWLDLPAALAADCAAAGIAQVARTAISTSRDPRLRSHRRDGRGHPQLLVAWRDACAG